MSNMQVLIVGEDDLIAWAIRKRFSAMQIPVRIVPDPGEVLADLRAGVYGLVVLDPGHRKIEPPAGVRVVEKPLNVFDLDRVVQGMSGRFSEKRGGSRHPCNIPVSIFLQEEERAGAGTDWGHPTGVAAEASETGLRVYTSHLLVPGQLLQLSPLSVHNPLARFVRRDRVAEVVWVVADEEGVIAGLRYLG